MIASLQEVLADAETEAVPNQAPPLAAVCIGLPAAVDPATGQVTGVPLYPQLRELSIKQRIASQFAVPCIVENDIKLAAFAENRLGSGTRCRNLVYLDLNNGIGAGIILDNRLVRGSSGCAGEIGYARTAANADAPSLEETASLAAICRIAGLPDPAQVFAAVAAVGGGAAAAAIERSVAHVATALLTTILVVNPELVVIGGDILEMPEVGVLYLDPLRDWIRQHAPFTPPLIEPSALGAEACVRGAALYAVESLLLAKYPFAAGVPYSDIPAQIQHI